jgi:hypothetical protein
LRAGRGAPSGAIVRADENPQRPLKRVPASEEF